MLHQMAPGQVNLSLKENHSLHAPSRLAGWQGKLDTITYMYIILALQLKAGEIFLSFKFEFGVH